MRWKSSSTSGWVCGEGMEVKRWLRIFALPGLAAAAAGGFLARRLRRGAAARAAPAEDADSTAENIEPTAGDAEAGGGIPVPPLALRRIVGPTDPADFDNPSGEPIWGDLALGPLAAGQAYRRIFDFGCGCGRNARQLMLQAAPPERYVGIDIHRGMIGWCRAHLAPRATGFEFHHHDVWNRTYAPENSRNEHLPLTPYGKDFTLVNAHSVFTHLLEHQTRFYLRECRDLLGKGGLLRTTWFFFHRDWFPVLAPHQHCLYVNEIDPTQAVYYDWDFFLELLRELGLKIVDVVWTKKAGYQSALYLAAGDAFEDLAPELTPPPVILGFGPSTPRDDDTPPSPGGNR